jgi:hypothetical protein
MLSPAPAIVAGTMRLVDERTPDGSRHFACLPQTAAWASVCDYAMALPSAKLVNFVNDAHAGAWLDFCFRQHRFLISAHEGRLRLFVRDPQCPDLILYQVGCHFSQLLEEADDGDGLPHPQATGTTGPMDPKPVP